MIDATARDVSTLNAPMAPSRWERLKRWQFKHRHAVEGWSILTPILLYYAVFFLFPVFASLFLSFTKWSGLSGSPQWVGLANYQRFLSDATYRTIIGNTVVFAVSILLIQTSLAIVIALMLNAKIWGRGLFRAAWYVPTLTSAAVMAQVAFVFISPADGVINMVLRQLKLPSIIFYTQVDWMRVIIIAYSVWRGVGGAVVLYLAALQGIHPELYEAAQVDGANGRQLFRHITLPLLTPMTIFVLVTGIIGTAQIFEAVMFLSKGGPANLTNVLMLQIYQDAFANQSLGMASAGAIFLGLMLLVFSGFQMRIFSRGKVME
ncbi:MAG: sugar ABC transporter permease [Chloroflexi bacterium]|nr:sugar ABC transporter permease [Chloroflexota bacterium]